MRRILFSLFALGLFGSISNAQALFNYQAVLRDVQGKPRVNEQVTVRFELSTFNSQTFETRYAEEHLTTTSAYGMVNLIVGGGKAVVGRQSDISWIDTLPNGTLQVRQYAISVFVDGTQLIPPTYLQYTPYARVADQALNVVNDRVDDADNDPGNEIQSLNLRNDSLFISHAGPQGAVDLSRYVNAPPQKLRISNDTLFLDDGGFVKLPPDTDRQQISRSNDTIYLENGGFVVLPPDANTDEQRLSLRNDTIFLDRGGFIVLPDQRNRYWGTKGNTADSSYFIGTLNDQPLRFRVNNTDFGQISPYSIMLGDHNGLNPSPFNSNIAIGNESLIKDQTGNANIGIGQKVLSNSTQTVKNIAIGEYALSDAAHSSYNVAIGYTSGANDSVSFNNTYLGAFSGAASNKKYVYNNTYIGMLSGNEATGNQNVFLGYEAGQNDTSSNAFIVANAEKRELLQGRFDSRTLNIGGSLTIDSAYTLPIGDGKAGDVITTNGKGKLDWTPLPELKLQGDTLIHGSDSLLLGNTFWTTQGNAPDSGAFIGTTNHEPLRLRSANKSVGHFSARGGVVLGEQAIIGNDTFNNIVIGPKGMESALDPSVNSNTERNLAIGANSLSNLVDGFENVALGHLALYSSDSARGTVAIGTYAGANDLNSFANTYVGPYAGYGQAPDSSAELNVAMGAQAGFDSKGDRNVQVGSFAGHTSSGKYNLHLGTYSGFQSKGDNNVFIGPFSGALDSGSNMLIINNFLDTTGKIPALIRGSFDQRTLDINAELQINQAYKMPLTDGNKGQYLSTDGAGQAFWIDPKKVRITRDTFYYGDEAISIINKGGVWNNDSTNVWLKTWDEDINFIFGADSVNDNGASSADNSRMLFVKNRAAFRAGYASDKQFNTDSMGLYSFAAGFDNKALAVGAFVGGGYLNSASDSFATVVGGGLNQATSNFSTVGGGLVNTASGIYSGVHSGTANKAVGNASYVGGGANNSSTGESSVVSGGSSNKTEFNNSGVHNGSENTASAFQAFIGGGKRNKVQGSNSAVVAGEENEAKGKSSFIGSGYKNDENGEFNAIAGGYDNTIENNYGFIGSGIQNRVLGLNGVVSGGMMNLSHDTMSAVSGGFGNTANGDYAFVGAGFGNQVLAGFSAVSGGDSNKIEGKFGYIGAGSHNRILTNFNAIGGGERNAIQGDYSLIAGGHANIIAGSSGFIGGGDTNIIQGNGSSIAGGRSNAIVANYAGVLSGRKSGVAGDYGVAAGDHAISASYGEIVLGYYNTLYTPANRTAADSSDRLLVIGNGAAGKTHDALVLRKDNLLHLNGPIALSNGSDTVNYPNFDGTQGQVLTTNGMGDLYWSTPTSGGGSSSASGAFVNDSSKVYLNYLNDTLVFIVGSKSIDNNQSTSSDDSRLMFDKQYASLRVGKNATKGWDRDSINLQCTYVFGQENQVKQKFNSILGGHNNQTTDFVEYGFVGSGSYNRVEGSNGAIVSGSFNKVGGYASFMGGGANNTLASEYGVIGGGVYNEMQGNLNGILGGGYNYNNSYAGVICGGSGNKAVEAYTFIGGGDANYDSSYYGVIGGGQSNAVRGQFASILGGTANYARDTNTFIGGGKRNRALRYGSSICGGEQNKAYGKLSHIGSGNGLIAQSYAETVFGSFNDTVTSWNANGITSGNRLFVLGNGQSNSSRSSAFVVYKNGNALLAGTLTQSSDARLKKNVGSITDPFGNLMALKGKQYYWNGLRNHDTTQLQYGFIAQEVQQVLPHLVDTDAEGYLSVNYTALIPVLVEALKELKLENDELHKDNDSLRKEIGNLSGQVQAILTRLDSNQ